MGLAFASSYESYQMRCSGRKPLGGMILYSKPWKELWIGGGDWVSVLTSCVLDESLGLPETGCFLSGLSVIAPVPVGSLDSALYGVST